MLAECPAIIYAGIDVEPHELRSEPSAVERKAGVLAPRSRSRSDDRVGLRISVILHPVNHVLLVTGVGHLSSVVICSCQTYVEAFSYE